MRKFLRNFCLSLAAAACMAHLAAAEIYIRNKPLDKAVEQNNVLYLKRASLSRYFTADELARCSFDPKTGEVKVDGTVIGAALQGGADELVPVLALAEALGYQKKVNRELGVTDYIVVVTHQSQAATAAAHNTGGADYRLAESRMNMAFRKSPQMSSHPDLARVQKIGQQLVAVSEMPTLTWNFFVVHDSEPNAFCTGAGWVAVTDSLLALKLSDDELAGVLSHEIGHGCRKDLEEKKFNKEQMARYAGEAKALYAQREALHAQKMQLLAKAQYALDLSKTATTSSQASLYIDEAEKAMKEADALDKPIKKLDKAIDAKVKSYEDKKVLVTDSRFIQKDEYDADVKGIYYATKAGFGSNGLMDSLQKLSHANAERFGQAAYQGGFSHPPVGERIELMNKVLRDWRSQH